MANDRMNRTRQGSLGTQMFAFYSKGSACPTSIGDFFRMGVVIGRALMPGPPSLEVEHDRGFRGWLPLGIRNEDDPEIDGLLQILPDLSLRYRRRLERLPQRPPAVKLAEDPQPCPRIALRQ